MSHLSFIRRLSALVLVCAGLLSAGDVTLRADPTTLTRGQGVHVTVTATGKNIQFPSLRTIDGYPIESPAIHEKIEATYTNGSFKSLRQKIMQFVFYPERNVTIPALDVQVDGTTRHTKPLSIHVRPAASGAHAGDTYRLQMRSTRSTLYVGEAFLLQVIFFEPRDSNVAQAQYIAPKFDGFFVKASPQERLEQTAQGTAHIFDYILTPQHEGNLTVTAPQIKLGIQTFSGARDPWGFFSNEIHWQSLQSTPKTFTVKPTPSSVDLIGNFALHATVDTTHAQANKPISYTLTLQGQGGLDALDEPTFDLPDVTLYSEDAQSDTQIVNGQITSHWEKHYTFIADHNFTIPAVHLKAFDPMTGKIRTLTSDPIAVAITGASRHRTPAHTPTKRTQKTAAKTTTAAQPQHNTPPTPHTNRSAHTDTNRSLFEDTGYYARMADQTRKSRWPWWSLLVALAVGFILGVMAGRIRPRLPRRPGRRHTYTPDEALGILYPHIHDSAEAEAMVRDLYRIKNGETLSIDPDRLTRLVEQFKHPTPSTS